MEAGSQPAAPDARRLGARIRRTGLAVACGLVAIPAGALALASGTPRMPAQASTACRLAATVAPGYCGDGGPADHAGYAAPRDVATTPDGGLLIADGQNSVVRRVDGATDTISTVAGLGIVGDVAPRRPTSVADAALWDPRGVAGLADGSFAIADPGLRAVLLVTPDGLVRTVLGSSALRLPVDVASVDDHTVAVADAAAGRVLEVDVRTGARRLVASHLATPWQVAVDPAAPGGLIVTDTGASPESARGQHTVGDVVRLAPGRARTIIAGPGASGPAGALRFERVAGVAVRSDGAVLVADRHTVDAVYPTGAVEVVATGLGQAEGIAVSGSQLVISDSANNRIVHVPAFLPVAPIPCDGCTSTTTTETTSTPAAAPGPPGPAGSLGEAGRPGSPGHPASTGPPPRPASHQNVMAQAPGALPPCARLAPRGFGVVGVFGRQILVDFPIAGLLQVMLSHTRRGVPAVRLFERNYGAAAGRQVPVPLRRTTGTWWIQLQTRVGCAPDDFARTL